MFLLILSLSYTIGQALSLEFETPFCEKKTPEEVAKHSIDNGLNDGDFSGCWITKRFLKRDSMLFNDTYVAVPQKIGFKFIAFMLVTLLLFCFVIGSAYKLIIDIALYRKKKLGTNVNIKSPKSTRFQTASNALHNRFICDYISKSAKIVKKWFEMYSKIFYTDSGWWIVKKILTEIFEIFVQTSALLYYNGSVLFPSSEHIDVILALKHQYIIIFAVFLSTNCAFCCIIWLFYAFKPILCNGLVFEIVLVSVDVIFDTFYTLFSLMVVVQGNSTFITALASLQKDDAIAFWATFIPLVFLCWTSFKFSRRSKRAMAYAANANIQMAATAALSTGKIANASSSNYSNTATAPSLNTSSNIISTAHSLYSSTSFIQATTTKIHNPLYKRISIVAVALMFGIYGIVLMSKVGNHFTEAIRYCSSVVHDLDQLEFIYDENRTDSTYSLPADTQSILDNHNELFFWDRCFFKVYPFGVDKNSDPICECREFKTKYEDKWSDEMIWSIDELYEYFDLTLIDILESVLIHFHMLEKFRWQGTRTLYRKYNKGVPPMLNMSKDVFGAHKMRIFQITKTPISYIDPAISNWKSLAFLDMGHCDFASLPDSIKHLKSLQYIELSENNEIEIFPEGICAMKKLKAIVMETTPIKYVPHCVAQLPELQSLVFTGAFLLEGVPIELFAMKNLVEISGIRSSISLDSLMSYNNISSVSELDDIFVWNRGHNYWFETSDFCGEVESLSVDSNFFQFVNETQCCTEACDILSAFDAFQCLSFHNNNGVCDSSCNNARCHWDGGDCSQLCDCDISSFGDGVCDIACNTTNCLYDGYDCIPAPFDADECEASYESHGCSVEWVGDLWCDSLCFESIECGQDLKDCKGCSKKTNCGSVYALFSFVATVVTNDDFISIDELNAVWYLSNELNPFGKTIYETPSEAMDEIDVNKDGLLSMREVVIGMHSLFNITKAKALQVDCSACFDGLVHGYWDR